MATTAQITANRENARKSTGPTTEAGKLASSVNNRKHGFRGDFFFAPAENPEEFYELHANYTDEWQPRTETERNLVQILVESFWLRKRAQILSTTAAARTDIDPVVQMKHVDMYMRYEGKYERAFHKCRRELEQIKEQRRKEEIGFERHAAKLNEEIRKENAHLIKMRIAEAKLEKLKSASNAPKSQPTDRRSDSGSYGFRLRKLKHAER